MSIYVYVGGYATQRRQSRPRIKADVTTFTSGRDLWVNGNAPLFRRTWWINLGRGPRMFSAPARRVWPRHG